MGLMQEVAKIGMALASSFTANDHSALSTASIAKTSSPAPVVRPVGSEINLANTYFVSTPKMQDGETQDRGGVTLRPPRPVVLRQSKPIVLRGPSQPVLREPSQPVLRESRPLQYTQPSAPVLVPSAPLVPAYSSFFSNYGYGVPFNSNYNYGVPFNRYNGYGYTSPFDSRNRYYAYNKLFGHPLNYGRRGSSYNPYGNPFGSVRFGFPVGDGYMSILNNRGTPSIFYTQPGLQFNTSPFGNSLRFNNNGTNFSIWGR